MAQCPCRARSRAIGRASPRKWSARPCRCRCAPTVATRCATPGADERERHRLPLPGRTDGVGQERRRAGNRRRARAAPRGRDRQRRFSARLPRHGHRHREARRRRSQRRAAPSDRHRRAERALFGGALRRRCTAGDRCDPLARRDAAPRRRHDAVLQGAVRRPRRAPRGRPCGARRARRARRTRRLACATRRARRRRPGERRAHRAARKPAHPARARGAPRQRPAALGLAQPARRPHPAADRARAERPRLAARAHRRTFRGDARRRLRRRGAPPARARRPAPRPAFDARRRLSAGVVGAR